MQFKLKMASFGGGFQRGNVFTGHSQDFSVRQVVTTGSLLSDRNAFLSAAYGSLQYSSAGAFGPSVGRSIYDTQTDSDRLRNSSNLVLLQQPGIQTYSELYLLENQKQNLSRLGSSVGLDSEPNRWNSINRVSESQFVQVQPERLGVGLGEAILAQRQLSLQQDYRTSMDTTQGFRRDTYSNENLSLSSQTQGRPRSPPCAGLLDYQGARQEQQGVSGTGRRDDDYRSGATASVSRRSPERRFGGFSSRERETKRSRSRDRDRDARRDQTARSTRDRDRGGKTSDRERDERRDRDRSRERGKGHEKRDHDRPRNRSRDGDRPERDGREKDRSVRERSDRDRRDRSSDKVDRSSDRERVDRSSDRERGDRSSDRDRSFRGSDRDRHSKRRNEEPTRDRSREGGNSDVPWVPPPLPEHLRQAAIKNSLSQMTRPSHTDQAAASTSSQGGIQNQFQNDGSFMQMFRKLKQSGQIAAVSENSNTSDGAVSDTGSASASQPSVSGVATSGASELVSASSGLLVVAKRRISKILKTGVVQKKRKIVEADKSTPTDAWSRYMNEVQKYRANKCIEDETSHPLMK